MSQPQVIGSAAAATLPLTGNNAVGLVLAGIALVLVLNQIIAKWTHVNPRDPGILLAGAILLGLVSGLACAIPAHRASEVDPMIALRSE